MAFFSWPLLVWTEAVKYGRDRARAMRRRWKFGVPVAGAIFSAFAILSVVARTQYDPPPQPVSVEKWIGLWFVGFVGLSLVIWAAGYIPLSRRIYLFQKQMRIGKIVFALNRIRAVVWELRDDYWILRITMDSDRTREVAVGADIRPRVEKIFSEAKIPG